MDKNHEPHNALLVELPSALDPAGKSQFLNATIHSQLGEPWELEARFAIARNAPKINAALYAIRWILNGNSPLTFHGHTHTLTQSALTPDFDQLCLQACAVQLAHKSIPHQRIHASSHGLAPILRTLFGDETAWDFDEGIFAKPLHPQWIQYAESNLDFVQRIAEQHQGILSWLPGSQHSWCTIHTELPNCGEPVLLSSEHLRTSQYEQSHCGESLRITTAQRGLYPGKTVRFAGQETTWLISSAQHQIALEGNVLGHGASIPYHCSITLVSMEEWKPQARAKPLRPLLRGRIASAHEAQSSPPFHRDGTYPILFECEKFQHLGWGHVPMMHALGGARGGMHLPLEVGTQVLCGFAEDPDHPMILGAVENPGERQLADQAHARKHCFQTTQGLRIEVEDFEEGGSALAIMTPTGQQFLLNSASNVMELHNGKQRISINGQQQSIQIESAPDAKIFIDGAAQRICLEAKHGILQKLSEQTYLEINSNHDMTLACEGCLTLQAKDIHLQSQGEFVCQAQGSMEFKGNPIQLN